MPASPVKAATAIPMRTSPFDVKGLRTVHNVGGIVTAIASRQRPTNIAAAGQEFGRPFANARSSDAVTTRPSWCRTKNYSTAAKNQDTSRRMDRFKMTRQECAWLPVLLGF